MKKRLNMFTTILSVLACFGLLSQSQAGTDRGNGNTSDGFNALNLLGTGAFNTAEGWFSQGFLTSGNFNTAIGAGSLDINNGDLNTAAGTAAMLLNISATSNVAVGANALEFNDFTATSPSTANNNTAVGDLALFQNLDGGNNTAMGAVTMETLTTAGADENTVVGFGTGNNIKGGSGNIYLGVRAGAGVGDEYAFIRIGEVAPPIVYDTFIQGIFGRTVDAASAMFTFTDSDGKVGTVLSSRRFKHDIKAMDKASEAILALKPVAFHYNNDKKNTPCFGLIAEDVAEVNPALVVPDKEGKPLTVRYDQINAMLLNEFLKEHKRVEEQQASISQLKSEMQTMVAQLKEQAAQIQKVSAQLEVNKPAPQVVANKP